MAIASPLSPNILGEVLSALEQRGIGRAEATPYINQYYRQTIIIKFGGNVFGPIDKNKHAEGADSSLKNFADNIVLLKKMGARPLVVHGGGPEIEKRLQAAKITTTILHGLRVTDDRTMDIVATAMTDINQQLTNALTHAGGRVMSLPRGLVKAKKLLQQGLDLGFVGEPIAIKEQEKIKLTSDDLIPILSPVGFDDNGHAYNINADNFAGFIATSLSAERLLLLTNINGLLDKKENLISEASEARISQLIAEGTISGGMIPKIKTALAALHGGTRAVVIIDGRVKDAVLRELFTPRGSGTIITPS